MIYMIADDPAGGALLDQQANRELDQIIHGALSVNRDQLYVAVQLDFRSQPDVWRRVIGEGAWLQPESDAADPETLYGFFEWAQRMCPADRYALILWGHSRGPFGLFTDAPFSSALSGLFAKADPWTYVAQTLTLKELRSAFRHARECLNQEVDIIAFKDCFMSTLETAYELKDAATYLIGSPDIVPIEGWPYARMFEQLARQPEAKLAAKALVKELEQYYKVEANRHGRTEVPFTLMDTSKLSDVSEPLRAIATKLTAETARGNGGEPFRKALTGSAKADPALVDVNTLCRKIKRHGLKQPAEHLEAALANMTLSDDKSVSLFCFPFAKKDQTRSIVAHHATRPVYSELAIVKTGWDGVALKAMPKVEPPEPVAYHHHEREGSNPEYMRPAHCCLCCSNSCSVRASSRISAARDSTCCAGCWPIWRRKPRLDVRASCRELEGSRVRQGGWLRGRRSRQGIRLRRHASSDQRCARSRRVTHAPRTRKTPEAVDDSPSADLGRPCCWPSALALFVARRPTRKASPTPAAIRQALDAGAYASRRRAGHARPLRSSNRSGHPIRRPCCARRTCSSNGAGPERQRR